ncbi:hypothetical protein BRARA_B00938 [Brassica rapa]|uniref:Uncharacterized protein n=1 Tax=Brassica campestris TaxID=3711 RepID=A0A398A7M3_BRACM|nr:hypothetical protein BRARA_B00938 [Brassica rapa]
MGDDNSSSTDTTTTNTTAPLAITAPSLYYCIQSLPTFVSMHMGSDLILVGVIGCGCICSRQPKFSLRIIYVNQSNFPFFKITHNKKFSTKLKYGYRKFNFQNN